MVDLLMQQNAGSIPAPRILEWRRYGANGVIWLGEINGKRYFQITHMSDGTYYGMMDSSEGYYGVLEKARDLDEAMKFCNWVSRAMGWS